MQEGRLAAYTRRVFALDVRSLAVMRIAVALTVLVDLCTRAVHLTEHYSDDGVLPRDVARATSALADVSLLSLSGACACPGSEIAWECAGSSATPSVRDSAPHGRAEASAGLLQCAAVRPGNREFAEATDMRFTSFVHDGDYGASLPWSGDVVPPVGEPKLEVPH